MDIVAVLTRVVQAQQQTVDAQEKRIAELAARVEALEAVRRR
jgi:cell division protein FtsB